VSKDDFKPSEQVQALSLIDEPGGAQKVREMLQDARKKEPNATLFPEATVNLIAYEFRQAGDTKSAVEVAKLNVEAYPNSPNADDSLGDMYLAAGQKDLALAASKKCLELLQTDTKDPQQLKDAIKASAEAKVKQLSAPAQ
jgi:tetratricopeptide (TPR) repeat protein